MAWNNFIKDRDSNGQQVVRPAMFVTYGVKHVKFWSQATDTVSDCLSVVYISDYEMLRRNPFLELDLLLSKLSETTLQTYEMI